MSVVPHETVTAPTSSETIGVLDRLDMLRRQAGFLATTRGELNEAFGLLAFADRPGGAATHLAEIAAHQYKHKADPIQAQLSVTREYGGYALRARTDRTMLRTLQEELQDSAKHHPFSALNPNSLYTGKGQLVRFIDLGKLATQKDTTKFPFVPLRGYTKGERNAVDPYVATRPAIDVAIHIDTEVHKIRTGKAPALVAAAIADQKHRFEFWSERLEEIEGHQTGVVRHAARRSLQELGIHSK